jgi:parvulin-like peptidyl-prolyl isomerase
MAAMVNGEGITLLEFQSERDRFLSALEASGTGHTLTESEITRIVLDNLIHQVLLAQEAYRQGFELTEAELQTRIDQLAAQLGSEKALAAWQSQFGYTPESFRLALSREIAAAWMRDQIIAQVPQRAEQVHARQIFVYNVAQAEDLLAELQAGADFDTLAARFDPLGQGDLGWFPRGFLYVPEVEAAAFSLQPGEVSEIVTSDLGYHLIFVVERQSDRPLEPMALLALQKQALNQWLAAQRETSDIQILLPLGD